MTASLRDLAVGAYCQGTTWWNYRTPDSRREIEAPHYWKGFMGNGEGGRPSVGRLKEGDWVFVHHTEVPGNSLYAVRRPNTRGEDIPQLVRLVSTFGEG